MKFGKIILIIFAGIMTIYSFTKGIIKENGSKNKNITEPTNKIIKDTVKVDDYNVLFFSPDEKEFNEIKKRFGKDSLDIYAIDSDFNYFLNSVYGSLLETQLKIKIITERIIELNTKDGIKYIDRFNNIEFDYGVIFNKLNCDPKINFGVMTGIDILQELDEYLKNCK